MKIKLLPFMACLLALVFTGCKFFNSTTENVLIDDQAIEVEDEDLFNEDIAPDEGQEVWTSFGGTYFFWKDGGSVVVDFPLPQEGGPVKFIYGDSELTATANEQTGKIVAKDSLGHVIFKGYFYDGGNTIRGLLNGKPFEAMGSGD